jgi:hypothetical protein
MKREEGGVRVRGSGGEGMGLSEDSGINYFNFQIKYINK